MKDNLLNLSKQVNCQLTRDKAEANSNTHLGNEKSLMTTFTVFPLNVGFCRIISIQLLHWDYLCGPTINIAENSRHRTCICNQIHNCETADIRA